MGGVVFFEEHALARLRAKLGAAEEAREDLIAFARGHSGAVSAIHEAVLAAIAAEGIDGLIDVVTKDWPAILGIDSVSLALAVGDDGFRAGFDGVQKVAKQLVLNAAGSAGDVTMRNVERGHPLFGSSGVEIRAEALIAIDCGPGMPRGLLLLGQNEPYPLENGHGGDLLRFLGRTLGAIIAGWLKTPNP